MKKAQGLITSLILILSPFSATARENNINEKRIVAESVSRGIKEAQRVHDRRYLTLPLGRVAGHMLRELEANNVSFQSQIDFINKLVKEPGLKGYWDRAKNKIPVIYSPKIGEYSKQKNEALMRLSKVREAKLTPADIVTLANSIEIGCYSSSTIPNKMFTHLKKLLEKQQDKHVGNHAELEQIYQGLKVIKDKLKNIKQLDDWGTPDFG
jgi:hypothetical protein